LGFILSCAANGRIFLDFLWLLCCLYGVTLLTIWKNM